MCRGLNALNRGAAAVSILYKNELTMISYKRKKYEKKEAIPPPKRCALEQLSSSFYRELRALILLLRRLVIRRHAIFLAEVWIHSRRADSHVTHAAAHHALTRRRLCLSEPRRPKPSRLVFSSPLTRLTLRVVFLDDARDL